MLPLPLLPCHDEEVVPVLPAAPAEPEDPVTAFFVSAGRVPHPPPLVDSSQQELDQTIANELTAPWSSLAG